MFPPHVPMPWGFLLPEKAVHMPKSDIKHFQKSYIAEAKALAWHGATDGEIADYFSIGLQTLHVWKAQNPKFHDVLQAEKHLADERVERSLYQRCVGYSYEGEKIIPPTAARDLIRIMTKEHMPPDVSACLFWLKNRRPDLWKAAPEAKTEAIDQTTSVAPIVTDEPLPLSPVW